MAIQETNERPQRLEISPEIGRHIEVLDIAQKVAQVRYGTTIDGLRQLGEPTNDYSKISQVMEEANRIVGPEKQFVSDYRIWQETKGAGSHSMNFQDWRRARNEAYKTEYERLSRELGEGDE